MDDIKITGLRTRAVNAPLPYPLKTASGVIATSPLVLIDLFTNANVTGRAYVFAYTPLALKPLQSMVDELGAIVRDMPLSPVEIDRAMNARFRLIGHTGLLKMATSGIDMAAWDARAKAQGLPLAELLGGKARPVPAYDSHGLDDIELGTKRAKEAAQAGFRAVKTKLGYATLEHDLKVVRALRNAMGEGVELMVDYNQGLSVPEAQRRGRALEQEGIAWMEEPTLQQDYAGHAAIRETVSIPVQIGENWFGPDEMLKAITRGACDLCMPDLMKIGGVTGWMKASALAEQYGLPMSSHIFQEFSAHMLAVTPTAHWLERMDLAGPVLEPMLTFRDGNAIVGDEPGAGVTWREEAISRYLV